MTPPPPDIEQFFRDPAEIDREIIRRARAKTVKALFAAWVIGGLFGIFLVAMARAEPLIGPVRVIDGDTVSLSSGEVIRILNIDAPETWRARCNAENAIGLAAKARLTALLRGASLDIQRCDGSRCIDPYGRTLARISANGRDVGETMITEGLASRWPKRWNGCGGAG